MILFNLDNVGQEDYYLSFSCIRIYPFPALGFEDLQILIYVNGQSFLRSRL
jgi:hypothetical protein